MFRKQKAFLNWKQSTGIPFGAFCKRTKLKIYVPKYWKDKDFFKDWISSGTIFFKSHGDQDGENDIVIRVYTWWNSVFNFIAKISKEEKFLRRNCWMFISLTSSVYVFFFFKFRFINYLSIQNFGFGIYVSCKFFCASKVVFKRSLICRYCKLLYTIRGVSIYL